LEVKANLNMLSGEQIAMSELKSWNAFRIREVSERRAVATFPEDI
jgi:hypothetical protein